MLKETKGPGLVITLGFTDGEKLIGIPPKEKKEEDLKVEFMTPELLEELGNDVMTLCKAVETPKQEMAKVQEVKRYGITEMPAGRDNERD